MSCSRSSIAPASPASTPKASTGSPSHSSTRCAAQGATYTGTLPELAPGERMPLIAVCALAAAMPSCVLGELARELTLLADELNAATTAGHAATAAANSASAEQPSPSTGHQHRPVRGRIGQVTSPQPPQGIRSLIPTSRTHATPGELAAAQPLHLRTATIPVPVLAAAAALIAPRLDVPDPATRKAASAVHTRLLAAIEDAAPDR